MNCRTDVLGGHVHRCECGHVDGVWYNSCKHRACPQCGALPNARWLETQEERLLDCDHYLAVFTMPRELLPFWLRCGKFPNRACTVSATCMS